MNQLKNENFIRALLREPVDRTPVWMMRQAGRYLPEYLELRKKHTDFVAFCHNPDACVQAMLQPLARFDLDAAIVFNDILTIADAMGMSLQFIKGSGPVFAEPLRDARAIESLSVITAEDMDYVMQTVAQASRALAGSVPLIGFAGSPFTVACYMIEGSGSKAWTRVKTLLYRQPELMHSLLDKLAQSTVAYLNGQIESGANAVMLFDTWGGILSHTAFTEFSLRYMQQIAASLHREYNGCRVPLVFFTKYAQPWLAQLADSGCDALSVDASIDLAWAKGCVGGKVALQGNLDPGVLFADNDTIVREVQRVLQVYNGASGFVFNLGHGIDKDTPIEGVKTMLAAVRAYPHDGEVG